MTYVLKSRPYLTYDIWGDGYYTGKSYVYQHEKYAICNKDLNKAKHYKSKAVAIRVCEGSALNFVNYIFDVVAVENGKEIEVFQILPD